MPRKPKVKSSSPPSSPLSWADDAQDLNKMLAETQRKIVEEHRRLASKALGDGKAHFEDVMQRVNLAVDVTYKTELNQTISTLAVGIQAQNTLLEGLYAELTAYNTELQAAPSSLLDSFQKGYEDGERVSSACGKVVQRGFNDEAKSVQVLKLAVGVANESEKQK